MSQRLRSLLDRTSRLLQAGHRTGDLNPPQVAALAYLSRANRFSRSPSQVADYLSATRGTVSQTLHALEGKGLIVPVRSDQDRRSLRYDLTEGRPGRAGRGVGDRRRPGPAPPVRGRGAGDRIGRPDDHPARRAPGPLLRHLPGLPPPRGPGGGRVLPPPGPPARRRGDGPRLLRARGRPGLTVSGTGPRSSASAPRPGPPSSPAAPGPRGS